jgi:ornithine cyclodeaminase
MTLLGDASTGMITSMLNEAEGELPNISRQPSQMDWPQIQSCLRETGEANIWRLQKQGFIAFSRGQVSIPPVIHISFKDRGDLHLKGAHKVQSDIYVFKIATSFPGNADQGLKPSQGLMIAFDARTAEPLLVLRDEGHLTDLRTAIAGRNAAEEMMAPDGVTGIGMLGTGVQARLQVALLKDLYPNCKKLTVWGRTTANTISYAEEISQGYWQVTIADSPQQVVDAANLIVTTTPSEEALIDADDIGIANTLIIAIGADMPGKLELSPALLKKASAVLIDSISQGIDHGNAAVAIQQGIIAESDLQEFGDFLVNGYRDVNAKSNLRIFLSSGIGVQDLQIVQAVLDGSNH